MTDIDWRARAEAAEAEVARLNKWADGFSDAQLKERSTGETYQRELRDRIKALEIDNYHDAYRGARDELLIARRELAAASEDSARLDWMIEHEASLHTTQGLHTNKWVIWWYEKPTYRKMMTQEQSSPRAAIDEARGHVQDDR